MEIGAAAKALRREATEQVVKKADDAFKASVQKTYQTYSKPNNQTGKIYRGRTSGTGTPQQNIARRSRNHHKNEDGYGPAKLDKSSKNQNAIRGREQQLIDKDRRRGVSGNQRNSISPSNKNRDEYMKAAKKEFKENN